MKIKQRLARFFLRDLFACQAMAAQMSKPLSTEDLRRMADQYPGVPIGLVFANKAYQMAEYMLAMREKPSNGRTPPPDERQPHTR